MSGGDRESVGGAVLVDPLGGLLLDPSNELRFKGPFDDYVTVSLTIRNPTEKRIAFKIKTTAPKRYCVKPNSGVLDPAQSMKVNVLLQPFNYDPNEKNKHKFMVQYLYLNDEEIQLSVNDILNMWKDVNTKRLLDMKLKCIFELTDEESKKISTNAPLSNNNETNTSNLSTYSTMDTTKPPVKQEQASSSVKAEIKAEIPDFDSSKKDIMLSATPTVNTASPKLQEKTKLSQSSNSSQPKNNDNLSNELKVMQKENEALKIEVANLREAEIRLRKLALSSASSSGGKQGSGATSLVDLLQNRLVLVIAVLVAIIFYLLLFR
jgi:vesicle-associated membrane protein-associated protein A